jgi:hypothetical protein
VRSADAELPCCASCGLPPLSSFDALSCSTPSPPDRCGDHGDGAGPQGPGDRRI